MFPPTVANLEWLSNFVTADEALAGGEAMGLPETILPRMKTDSEGNVVGVAVPGDADYESVLPPEFVFARFR